MIDWQPTTIQLSALVPWERNPKSISRAHAQRLLALWERLGQFQTIAIGPAGEVYDGHQRLSVLLAAHGGGYTVQALQSSRALTEAEREELVIAAHVGTVGQFDWNELSNWDAGALQEWGMDAELLQILRDDSTAIAVMLDATTWDDAFAKLPDSDRAPFQQMTFTLHDEQAEIVKDALILAQRHRRFAAHGQREQQR